MSFDLLKKMSKGWNSYVKLILKSLSNLINGKRKDLQCRSPFITGRVSPPITYRYKKIKYNTNDWYESRKWIIYQTRP